MKLTTILLATVVHAREDWQLPSEWAFCNAATVMPGVSLTFFSNLSVD